MKIINETAINPTLRYQLKEGIASDLAIAQLLIDGVIANDSSANFNKYSAIYRQTNEPFEKYLTKEAIEGKDVLTVSASGDFLISILRNNPKSVSTFDINVFSSYYQELKIAGIMALDYQEFLNFFYGNDNFNKTSLDKILPILPKKTKEFWEGIFSFYDALDVASSQLFVQNIVTVNTAISYNSFLKNEIEYLKTKKALYNLSYTFHNLDYNSLDEIKKKFDTIFLSNITDYQGYISLYSKIKNMKKTTDNLLKRNGVIIASTFNKSSAIERIDSTSVTEFDPVYAIKIKKTWKI